MSQLTDHGLPLQSKMKALREVAAGTETQVIQGTTVCPEVAARIVKMYDRLEPREQEDFVLRSIHAMYEFTVAAELMHGVQWKVVAMTDQK